MKKLLALLMVTVLTLSIFAGCQSGNSEKGTEATTQEKVTTNEDNTEAAKEAEDEGPLEPLKLTIGFVDDGNAPFNEEWAYIKAIEEKFNVELEFNIIPDEQKTQKPVTMINTGTAPDIIMFVQDYSLDYAESGALINVNDYKDQLPNYFSQLETSFDPNFVKTFSAADGDLLEFLGFTPVTQLMGSYIVRKDIMEAYGYESITTVEQLYELLAAYKADNPESMPFTGDNFNAMLYLASRSWGIDGGFSAQYFGGASQDYDNVGEYFYGYSSDKAKAMVSFFNDMYVNGLMDPEIFTQSTEQTVQKMMMGTSIATISWAAVAQAIDGNGKMMNGEDFSVEMILPLTSEAAPKFQMAANVKTSGWVIPATTSNRDDFDRVLKFVDDYLYSEDGILMQNYGIEGITYEMIDGAPAFLEEALAEQADWNKNYGVNNKNFVLMKQEEPVYAMMNENSVELNRAYNDADMPFVAAGTFVVPEGDKEVYGMLSQSLFNEANKNIQLFILDSRPLDEWDAYVQEMEDLGVQKLLEHLKSFTTIN